MHGLARLVFDDSERNADLFYLTGFLAGDPFLFLELDGRRILYLSDLEVDRGRAQSRVDEIARMEEVIGRVKKEGPVPSGVYEKIGLYLRRIAADRGIDSVVVPPTFPAALSDVLRGHGLGVRWEEPPFVPQRVVKSEEEIGHIRRAIEHTEAAIRAGIDRLAASRVEGEVLLEDGAPLTSEMVRSTISETLLKRGCFGADTIVAGGEHAVDPHDRGSGPLPANLPIILDVFPRDLSTRYHGDMTRTVVRGTASDEVKRMFATVKEAKERAEGMLKAGVDGYDVHEAVKETIQKAGFKTGEENGRMVGFFHGTGHGLGLDVHEWPRLSSVHETMNEGNVVTVEPGLYYPGIGGVRLEDDVVVRKDASENLCTLESVLEI